MEREPLSDLKLYGSGTAGGGAYRKIAIRGDGIIDADASCRTYSCMGSSTVEGSLQAEQLVVRGQQQIAGTAKIGRLRVAGELIVDGDMEIGSSRVFGSVRVGRSVKSDRLRVAGQLEVDGDVSAEELKASGILKVGGMLNAESAELRLHHGASRIGEIGGERVTVRPLRHWLLRWFAGGGQGAAMLEADTIEAGTIDLRATRARVVRGDNVMVGPGCRIDRVEYRNRLERAPGAAVGEAVKLT